MIIPVSRQCRTNKNSISIFVYRILDKGHRGSKKDSPIKNTDESSLVAGTRLERATFGL